ncbi:hypothetical protein ACIBI4_14055 [Streptomyces sp. NPDC050418]|uniref:hypothetical protein n=1 Tax=Streptomyces sp. NPDC050418 TaxID=3365612 RepID=UPI0037983497
MTTDPSEYEKAIPHVVAHLAKMERAVDRTRYRYAGQPYEVVRQALSDALREEGAQNIPAQVVDELAVQISRPVQQ